MSLINKCCIHELYQRKWLTGWEIMFNIGKLAIC